MRLNGKNSFLSFKRAGFLFVIIFSLNSWAIIVLNKINFSQKKSDCSLRNSRTESFLELVHEISIRGKEDRFSSIKFNSVLPLGCTNKHGDDRVFASATLISQKKIVTVLHTVVDKKTCAEIDDNSKCFVYDGTRKIEIKKWDIDPTKVCEENNGGEALILGELSLKIDRKIFPVACFDTLNTKEIRKLTTAGALPDNFKNFRIGSEAVVGEGAFWGESLQGERFKFENDIGGGDSGGAVYTKVNGKIYLIGIIRGDTYAGQYRKQYLSGKKMDGLKGDEWKNYGEALEINSQGPIPCEKLSQNGTASI